MSKKQTAEEFNKIKLKQLQNVKVLVDAELIVHEGKILRSKKEIVEEIVKQKIRQSQLKNSYNKRNEMTKKLKEHTKNNILAAGTVLNVLNWILVEDENEKVDN